MNEEIQEMLESIDMDENAKRPNELRKMLITASTANAPGIIKLIDNELGRGHPVGRNWSVNEAYYWLFDACIRELLQDHDQAIARASLAASVFEAGNLERQGWFNEQRVEWNAALTHWFLAIVYRNKNLIGKAEDELNKAVQILDELSEKAKKKFNFILSNRCQSQIKRISTSIDDARGVEAHASETDQSFFSYELFARIIAMLSTPDNEAYYEWLNGVYSLQPSETSSIHKQIDFAVEILEHEPEVDPLAIPLANSFLAHCYALGFFGGDDKSLPFAVKHAEEALKRFIVLELEYDQALINWYLALLYRYTSWQEKSIIYLQRSIRLLNKLLEISAGSIEHDGIVDLQKEVLGWLSKIDPSNCARQEKLDNQGSDSPNDLLNKIRRSNSSSRSGPASTPLTRNSFTIRGVQLQKTTPTEEPSNVSQEHHESKNNTALVGDAETSFHIIIPLDPHALIKPNSKSVPLDPKLYNQLMEYNIAKAGRFPANQHPEKQAPEAKLKPRSIIPPYPIYGRATAGAKGEINFEELECAAGVNDDYLLSLYGLRYGVYSTKEKDRQITIVKSNKYGWLRVDGHSMNITQPTPIDDQDYVLFYKIDVLESCEGKIVVASQSGLDEQPPRIMVKRLKAKRGPTGVKRYYLHSDSSLEVHRLDIEVTDVNQLVGEVVAIAKPIR